MKTSESPLPLIQVWETASEAQAVDIQLTAALSSAFLCDDDAAEGEFSLKVKADDETYTYAEWQTETTTEIADLIADVDANWTSLKLIGMTAKEVRAIPESALTSQLAGSDFSIVYCMRVPDVSTVGYYSRVTADYIEDLYASDTLTLNVTYINGTTEQITGLTSTQIEDFHGMDAESHFDQHDILFVQGGKH
jgi:hypothetical protein